MKNMQISKNSTNVVFLLAVFILGLSNILTYPYIPREGLFLTAFFLLTASFVVVISYMDKVRLSDSSWIFFSSFTVTTLLARAVVNNAGIGTPRSAGTLGPVSLEQVWIGGFHIHHYWLGFAAIGLAAYIWRKKSSVFRTAVLSGIGLALVMDEIGIILAGHTYHSFLSYAGLILTQCLLLGLVLRDSIKQI